VASSKTMEAKNAAKACYLASLSEAERLVLPLVLHQRHLALKQSLTNKDGSTNTESHPRSSKTGI
jgi:hypothetical protein